MYYQGVIDDDSDEKGVIYNGKKIPHVSSDPDPVDETLDWGYPGRGPLNTANSIMDHALGSEAKYVNTKALTNDFRAKFLAGLDADDDSWRISREDVLKFIEEQEA